MDVGTPTGWVPVFVPAEMAPEVLERVAAFVKAGTATGGPSEWSDAANEDLAVFFRETPGIEWALVAELARHERPVSVADLASALGVEVGSVAGAIGPINKRAKREGWMPPIQPVRFFPEGSRTSKRGLVLAERVRAWVRAHDGGETVR